MHWNKPKYRICRKTREGGVPSATAEWAIYRFMCQMQLLLSFIPNIIVVCKVESVFRLTNLVEMKL